MRKIRNDAVWIVGILVVALAVLWPLFRPGFFLSDDGEWMIIRLSAFFQSLREGQFPVRFLGRLNHGYGYPVANFLYPGFLYLGSAVHAFGFSFIDSVKILLAGSLIIAALLTFLWLRTFVGRFPSFIGALSFLFAPYVLFDLYTRGSVGEILAFVPAALGLWSIEKGNRSLFAAATAFLIVSHNSLAVLFLIFWFAYLFVRKKLSFLIPMGLGFSVSAFFWFPALFDRQFVQFDRTFVSDPSSYFLNAKTIALVGPVTVAAWIGLLQMKKGRLTMRPFFLWSFVLAVILATSLSRPVWNARMIAAIIQFPYRVLAVSALTGTWLVAHVVAGLGKKALPVVFLLCIVLWGAFSMPHVTGVRWIDRPEGFYTTNEATTTVADEYMPVWVTQSPQQRAGSRLELIQGSGTIDIRTATTQTIDVTVETPGVSTVQLNTIYYPGWGATVDTTPVPVRYDNPMGLMHIMVPAGTHRVKAEFRETVPRFAADVVTAGSVIVLGTWIFIETKTRRKRSKRYA